MRSESVIITPTGGAAGAGPRELWDYRQLLVFFIWRDLKVRYAQTVLGGLWAILQPLALAAIFAVFLGALVGVPSDGVPYPLFVLAGVVPWTYFSVTVVAASNSLVNSASLVSKIYFPRVLLPVASLGTTFIDLILAIGVLFALMAYYGRLPTQSIVWLPVVIVLLLTLTLGVGTWLAALNVRYRDIRYAVPFALQVGLWSSPIAYPASLVPDQWRALYGLNPLVGIVDLFRFSVLGTGAFPASEVMVSFAVAIAMCFLGVAYFRRVERAFADII